MLQTSTEPLVFFIIISVILILLLVIFIINIIYRYQQKQNTYLKDIQALKVSYENAMLQSQLEIQEQTFQNISREIHDNIGQKLTLAKLHLNTLNYSERDKSIIQVTDSISMISEAINDLSDISRSMSSEIILNNGLIKALEFEVIQLEKSGLYTINVNTEGYTVFLNSNTELILFRIAQETLNNIIKHAQATMINIHLNYTTSLFIMEITDNGKGFNKDDILLGTGLQNIKKRAAMLNGIIKLNSVQDTGTQIKIEVPLKESNANV